jgi:hypothetical protein
MIRCSAVVHNRKGGRRGILEVQGEVVGVTVQDVVLEERHLPGLELV